MDKSFDPALVDFGLSIVHPMVVQKGQAEGDRQIGLWRTWLKELAEHPDQVPEGWEVKSPDEDLNRLSIGRWSFREVKAQFFPDEDYDKACGTDPESEAIRPKLRWLSFAGPLRGNGLPEGGLPLDQLRLGLLHLKKRGSRKPKGDPGASAVGGAKPDPPKVPEVEVTLLPQEGRIEVFALLSVAMVELLVIQLCFDKGLALSRSMLVSHLAAHVDPADWLLVALPKKLAGQLQKRRHEAAGQNPDQPRPKADDPFPMLPEDLLSVLHLVHSRPGQKGEIDHFSRSPFKGLVGPSIPVLIQKSLLATAPTNDYWAPYHGRIPIAPRYLFPVEVTTDGRPGPEDDSAAWMALKDHESLLARALRHPGDSPVFPVEMADIEGPESTTLHITGTQRFHVTCEGFYAVGLAATEFDSTQWMSRVSRDYLATWLLVLHQATVLQRISMDSYMGNERREARNNEYLMARFLEFSTEYDFHQVSPQRNIQALYRTAREVLGVNSLVDEVSNELHRWVDDENRKEQQALNSVAVLAMLAALATSFVGLNLSYFNKDSAVGFWLGTPDAPAPGLLWLGLPVAVVLVALLARRSLRQHVRRVVRLLWRK